MVLKIWKELTKKWEKVGVEVKIGNLTVFELSFAPSSKVFTLAILGISLENEPRIPYEKKNVTLGIKPKKGKLEISKKPKIVSKPTGKRGRPKGSSSTTQNLKPTISTSTGKKRGRPPKTSTSMNGQEVLNQKTGPILPTPSVNH